MGGRKRVVAEAKKALEKDDCQWAAELATYAIRTDKDDPEARNIKAGALKKLGYRTMNINWRNWYLTSARELEGRKFGLSRRRFSSIICDFPTDVKLESLCSLLSAEKTVDMNLTIGFNFPDVDQHHAIEIRRGIAEFHDKYPDRVDASLSLDDNVLDDILMGSDDFQNGIKNGKIKVDGELKTIDRFLACFDEPKKLAEIHLTLR